jgi:RNA polymerase sigma-70 factor (ECF subfamily)
LDWDATEWVEIHYPKVQAYVHLRIPPQDCEDVIGEIMLAFWKNRESIRSNPSGWLFGLARRRIGEYFRIRKRNGLNRAKWTQPSPPSIPPSTLTPLESLETEEFRERLGRAIHALPEREREILALKFSGGLSNSEIAQSLGIQANHLGVLLFRCLRRLKMAMEEEGSLPKGDF